MLLRAAATARLAAGRAATLGAQPSASALLPPIARHPLAEPAGGQARPLRTSVITCMGRRSAKIATRKVNESALGGGRAHFFVCSPFFSRST
jgi:hypothetical protein